MPNKPRKCRCGCGELTGNSALHYKPGHKPVNRCVCGCGAVVSRPGAVASSHKGLALTFKSTTPCLCGCGEYPSLSNKYVHGHKPIPPTVSKVLCACGCGTLINPRTKYKAGHLKKCTTDVVPLCACGCGEYCLLSQKGNKYNKYIYGHQARGSNNSRFGTTFSEVTKHRISIGIREHIKENGCHWEGRKHSKETVAKFFQGENNHFYGKKHSPENMEKYREYTANMNRTNKNGPTKPERMSYAYFTSRFMEYVPEFPVKYYRVDLYVPDWNLLLFLDGCWWHACQTCCPTSPHRRVADDKRVEVLSALGYKVLSIWEHDVYERLDDILNNWIKNNG